MQKKTAKRDDKSLKTFFLYAFVVFFVILISLSIKSISVIRQSKFDGSNFNLAITKNDRAVAILGFNPVKNSTSIINIADSNIPVSSIGKSLGIITDGKINSKSELTANPE